MAKKVSKSDFWGNLAGGVAPFMAFVGIGLAILAVFLVDMYNKRQERNERLRLMCAAAMVAVEAGRTEYAGLSSRQNWADIKPVADGEKWGPAMAASLARIDQAAKAECKKGAKDLDACQFIADTVKEEMTGLTDHMRYVAAAASDRPGTIAELNKALGESSSLLVRAEKLMAVASPQEPADHTLVINMKEKLSLVKAGAHQPFSELYGNYKSALDTAERLRWLVDRLTQTKATTSDEWVVRVLQSVPAYKATFVRYTWDNMKDSPTISTVEATADVSKEVLESLGAYKGQKIADTTPGIMRDPSMGSQMASSLGLPTLAEVAYPPGDNTGEIYLDDCSEAIKATLQFNFKGETVQPTVSFYKQDLGILYPLTAGQSFILKPKNASTDQIKIPVWLAQTWTQVYNRQKPVP